MKLFSERNGYDVRKSLQIHDLVASTRSRLFNYLLTLTIERFVRVSNSFSRLGSLDDYQRRLLHNFKDNFLKIPITKKIHLYAAYDPVHSDYGKEFKFLIEECTLSNPWYRVLSFVEFFLENFNFNKDDQQEFHKSLNTIFEEEKVGYRMVDGMIVSITDPVELEALEQALQSPIDVAKDHIKKAALHCFNREKPDYTNSIKEAITAVEAAMRNKTKEHDFEKALNKLSPQMHSMFTDSIRKLYKYTNQRDTGVRHALMDDDPTHPIGEKEARYFLVTCSAFVNYVALLDTCK
jgi:hypothetical protein